jgi:hypothetical protein
MSEQGILDHLEAMGYDVAPCAYRDAVHYMRPRRGAGTWDRAALAGEKYSIDLECGLWNRWGDDGLWHPISELPQLTDGAEAPASLAPMMGASEATFVGECVKRGFVLDDHLVRCVDFGNRFARWTDGRRYLLFESAGTITDCASGDARSLEEFLSSGTPGTAAVESVPPRPFISMRERPVALQGARIQATLF